MELSRLRESSSDGGADDTAADFVPEIRLQVHARRLRHDLLEGAPHECELPSFSRPPSRVCLRLVCFCLSRALASRSNPDHPGPFRTKHYNTRIRQIQQYLQRTRPRVAWRSKSQLPVIDLNEVSQTAKWLEI